MDYGNDDDDNGLVRRKECGRLRQPACLVLACSPQPHGNSRERETVDEDDDLLSCGQPFIYPMKVYVADLARVRVARVRPVYVVVGFAADAEGGQGPGHKQTKHVGFRNEGGAKPQQIIRRPQLKVPYFLNNF